jgi:hypothetical protein
MKNIIRDQKTNRRSQNPTFVSGNRKSKIQNPKTPAPNVPKLCPYFVRSRMRRSIHDFAINDLANSATSSCPHLFALIFLPSSFCLCALCVLSRQSQFKMPGPKLGLKIQQKPLKFNFI